MNLNKTPVILGYLLLMILTPAATMANSLKTGVISHPSQGPVVNIEGATTKITSYEEGIAVNMQTKNLEPGHVYTLVFAVMNKPQDCANAPGLCTPVDVLKNWQVTGSDVVYADGAVADSSGTVNFRAFVEANQPQGFWFNSGLTNPMGAEIHLLVQDHGPAIADKLSSMLTSFRGGCRDEGLPKAAPTTAKADGEPGPNTCRLVQVSRFQQL